MTEAPPRLPLARVLADLPRWQAAGGEVDAIVRRLRFAGFPAAIAFMTRVAFEAERLDHHPEWSNVYDRVEIRLTTHDAGGVTERDRALATAIDRLVESGADASA